MSRCTQTRASTLSATLRLAERGIARPEFVRYLIGEHLGGRRDNRQLLYSLLILELWYRQDEECVLTSTYSHDTFADKLSY